MSYLTSSGQRVEYPFALASRIAFEGRKASTDDIRVLVHETSRIFNELQRADAEVITLRQQVQRLTHENEFMLRLINAKE